jgi:hypothetical protein
MTGKYKVVCSHNHKYEYVCYNRRHANAVEGFWDLRDNIYDYEIPRRAGVAQPV